MELYEVSVSGYRKLRTRSRLKTGCKLVAILGANEAGKSSLLAAIHRLNDAAPFAAHEISHDIGDHETRLSARYLLSEEDLKASGLKGAIWFERTKRANGLLSWSIEPRPAGREVRHRGRLLSTLEDLEGRSKFVERLADLDAEFLVEVREVITQLQTEDENLNDEAISALREVSTRAASLAENELPAYFRNFAALLARALTAETAENSRVRAANVLLSRVPKFLMFGSEERNLQSSYPVEELSEIPTALANLMEVAGCDLSTLLQHYSEGDQAKVDTIIDKTNDTLIDKFRQVWKQSAISVMISLRDQTLYIQVRNPDSRRTSFSERSDGLRQFVALQSFTTCRGEIDPILLIDEAEQHLHYDAQADLIQMLASQTVAPKIIYTTHSAGCLPEDLGNGVRLVAEESADSEWSKIKNKFWESDQSTFSPLLIGMGASTLAFFPTRAAVVVEGESDMLLYPTMIRACLGATSLGMQFVPGLSRVDHQQLPMLNTCGKRVCYLLDGDDGGKALKASLQKLGIPKAQILSLSRSGGECELEDFLDAKLLAAAVSGIARDVHKMAEFISPSALGRYGKWDAIKGSCEAKGIKAFSKVDVAYAVLSLIDADPHRPVLDSRLASGFARTAKAVVGFFSNDEEAERA